MCNAWVYTCLSYYHNDPSQQWNIPDHSLYWLYMVISQGCMDSVLLITQPEDQGRMKGMDTERLEVKSMKYFYESRFQTKMWRQTEAAHQRGSIEISSNKQKNIIQTFNGHFSFFIHFQKLQYIFDFLLFKKNQRHAWFSIWSN